ncbi:hypothetical protein P692DRAFT_20387966 [Suillus brevipes Sb2]|nr:hypothetical protein P692DRAFT_20387966 [Suillus brevipes Sb2]
MTTNLSMIEQEKFFEFMCSGVALLPTRMDSPHMLSIQPLAFTFLHCSLVFQFYAIVFGV